MPSFIECVKINVRKNSLNAKRADAIIKRYGEQYEEAKAAFGDSARAEEWAAHKAIETVTKINSAKVRARVKDIRVTAAFFERFRTTTDPDEQLLQIGLEMQNKLREIHGIIDSQMAESIDLNRPKWAGLKRELITPTRSSMNCTGRRAGTLRRRWWRMT